MTFCDTQEMRDRMGELSKQINAACYDALKRCRNDRQVFSCLDAYARLHAAKADMLWQSMGGAPQQTYQERPK